MTLGLNFTGTLVIPWGVSTLVLYLSTTWHGD